MPPAERTPRVRAVGEPADGRGVQPRRSAPQPLPHGTRAKVCLDGDQIVVLLSSPGVPTSWKHVLPLGLAGEQLERKMDELWVEAEHRTRVRDLYVVFSANICALV